MLNVFLMSPGHILKKLPCRSTFELQWKTQEIKTYGKFQTQQKIQDVKNWVRSPSAASSFFA